MGGGEWGSVDSLHLLEIKPSGRTSEPKHRSMNRALIAWCWEEPRRTFASWFLCVLILRDAAI